MLASAQIRALLWFFTLIWALLQSVPDPEPLSSWPGDVQISLALFYHPPGRSNVFADCDIHSLLPIRYPCLPCFLLEESHFGSCRTGPGDSHDWSKPVLTLLLLTPQPPWQQGGRHLVPATRTKQGSKCLSLPLSSCFRHDSCGYNGHLATVSRTPRKLQKFVTDTTELLNQGQHPLTSSRLLL